MKTKTNQLMNKSLPSLKKALKARDDAQAKIKSIQKKCTHPDQYCQYIYHSDTGNWSPSDDSYWTDYFCSRCLKHWSTAGSHARGTRVKEFIYVCD